MPDWTTKAAELWLIAAYRLDPRETNSGGRAPLSWPALYVWSQEHRIAVHTWAWAKATGQPISEICAEKGWSRATFERHRAAGIGQIVRALNREARLMQAAE